jgi:hypothetical protein
MGRVPRLYNPITEEILLLPKGGTYHLSSHTSLGNCSICNSELLIYQLPDNRKYPLCAWCYNHPQEDIWGPAPYPIISNSSNRSASALCHEAPLGDLHPINYARSICSLKHESELFYETGEYHKNNVAEKGKGKGGKGSNGGGSSGGGGGGGNSVIQFSAGGVLILEPSLAASSEKTNRFISTRSELSFTLPKAIEKVELLPVENTYRPIQVLEKKKREKKKQ